MPFLTLSAHPAIGALLLDQRPAWVWNCDGTRVLWSNGAGLTFFDATSMDELMNRSFGDVHPARRHLARLARIAKVNAPILDRLRFFIGENAEMAACLCKRLEVEGEAVLLVIATDQPTFADTESERAACLLQALGAESGKRAALLDASGHVVQSAGDCAFTDTNPTLVPDMLALLSDENRVVVRSYEDENHSYITGIARLGLDPRTSHLLLVRDPAEQEDADTLRLLIDELGGDEDWPDEDEMNSDAADIFGEDFTLEGDHEIALRDADRLRDGDVPAFLSDIPTGVPGFPASSDSSSQDAPSGESKGASLHELKRTALSGIASVSSAVHAAGDRSNVVTLPVRFERRREDSADAGTQVPPMPQETQADKGASSHTISDSDFRFDEGSGPHHFVWETDEVGRFTLVSPDLALAVGPASADILGRSWAEIAAAHGMDPDGKVAKAFESRDTWIGLAVIWPVDGFDLGVPVELTGLPVFGRFHGFQGFRGFGMCRTQNAQPILSGAMQDATSLENPDVNKEQKRTEFDHNDELHSDLLLQAARDAVAAAAEMISSGDLSGSVDTPDEGEADCGDTAVSFDDDIRSSAPEDNPEPHLRETDADNKPDVDDASRLDSYSLVSSLLSGQPSGIRESTLGDDAETEDMTAPEDSSDETGADQGSQSLSDLEQAAFDQIAQTLSHPSLESSDDDETGTPDLADLDEDSGEVEEILADINKLDEQEVCCEPPAIILDENSPIAQEPSAPKAPDATQENVPSHSQPVYTDRQASRDAGRDADLRSAASIAFREILAMDPAFRHMRERLTSLSHVDPEGSDKAEEDRTETVPTPDAPGSDAQRDEATAVDGAGNAPEENDITSHAEGAEVAHTLEVSAGADLESTEDNEANARATQAGVREELETNPALLAAAVAGVAALEGPSLWERKDSKSPLVDLLNKIPTAVMVSAEGQILFASRKALQMLSFGDVAELEAAGGMEGLFAGRPGDWLTKTDGRTTLRGASGAPISVLANISSINWGERPAAMLCFEKAPDTPPGLGISEEDEKIAELEAILDTATDGVVVLNEAGDILRMNHSAEALFEVDRHRVAGESFLALLAEESHRDALDYLQALKLNGVASVLKDGYEVIGRVGSRGGQGGFISLFLTMGRVAIPGSNRYCAVLRDIAQWKRTQEELIAEKMTAETSSQQKSEFLAKVSHEIRTPLNAIIGFSDVMLEERFGSIGSERYKDYLRDISTSGKHIMSLVNDLLDLSKVEAGKLDMQFEATQLNRIVTESVGLMQQQANRQQIIIRTSLSSRLPELAGDERSLRQIVLNLLSNGLKFTPAGGQIIVSTLCEDNGDVGLRIRDTGVGMSKEDIATALEPFRQVSNTRGMSEGSGLGLPLTKALVEANRARLSIKSEKDHGTLVEITFPKERVIAESEADSMA